METQLLEIIEKVASRLGIDRETLHKVYCRDEDVPDHVLERLLKFENEISKMGKDIDSLMTRFCESTRIEEKEKLEIETVVKIPVYVGGEEKNLNIVVKGRRIIVESDIEKVCKEPTDIILGETSIYLKCSGEWIVLLHGLRGEERNKIRRILSGEV
ncbi:MAG: hypothetical protein GXO26_00075 [Crenarchaeota archaeon]|nr:hypothetical protein [Thermoproteota archaeon]